MHLIYSQSYNIFASIPAPFVFPNGLRPALPGRPRNRPPYPRQRIQLPIPELHTPKLNHSRVETERLAHLVLHGAVGVVAHDEVVSVVVDCLMLGGTLRERGDAPVCNAPDCAAVLEDEGSGCASDTGGGVSGRKRHGWMGVMMGEDELFHLGEAAGADLGRC